MEITCKVAKTEERPVIFGFQNSIPCAEEFEDASYGIFQSVENKDDVAVKILGKKMTMFGKGKKTSPVEKLFVGVFNDKNKELTMVPATETIALVQKVNDFKPSVPETSEEISYIDRRKMLVNGFGNKKSKQIIRQRENARIESSNVIGGKAMQEILKLKGQSADLSNVMMKKPKASKKSKEPKEKATKESKEPKEKTTKKSTKN